MHAWFADVSDYRKLTLGVAVSCHEAAGETALYKAARCVTNLKLGNRSDEWKAYVSGLCKRHMGYTCRVFVSACASHCARTDCVGRSLRCHPSHWIDEQHVAYSVQPYQVTAFEPPAALLYYCRLYSFVCSLNQMHVVVPQGVLCM